MQLLALERRGSAPARRDLRAAAPLAALVLGLLHAVRARLLPFDPTALGLLALRSARNCCWQRLLTCSTLELPRGLSLLTLHLRRREAATARHAPRLHALAAAAMAAPARAAAAAVASIAGLHAATAATALPCAATRTALILGAAAVRHAPPPARHPASLPPGPQSPERRRPRRGIAWSSEFSSRTVKTVRSLHRSIA